MTQIVTNFIQVKQGRDHTQILTFENETGARLVIGLQATDIGQLQLREYRNSVPVAELKPFRHIQVFPVNGTTPEYVTLSFYGEETTNWELSALGKGQALLTIAETFDEGDLVLPKQKLYGTLLLTDAQGNDRAVSGLDLAYEMEITLTRPVPAPETSELTESA